LGRLRHLFWEILSAIVSRLIDASNVSAVEAQISLHVLPFDMQLCLILPNLELVVQDVVLLIIWGLAMRPHLIIGLSHLRGVLHKANRFKMLLKSVGVLIIVDGALSHVHRDQLLRVALVKLCLFHDLLHRRF
jgi:hypothetical protein